MTLECTRCGEVDMSPEAQHLRKVLYGIPVWQDEKESLGYMPMKQEEREKVYSRCPYHSNAPHMRDKDTIQPNKEY